MNYWVFLFFVVVTLATDCSTIYNTYSAWNSLTPIPTVVPTYAGPDGGSTLKSFTIPAGVNVVLNSSPPATIYLLSILGTLTFNPNANIVLKAYFISVNGVLQIGSPTCPINGSVEIIMFGNPLRSPSLPGYPLVSAPNNITSPYGFGTKGIGIKNGGLLQIRGQQRNVTWTTLSQTASIGSTSITVYAGTGFDWQKGEMIVIATTDFGVQNEVRNISTVTINKNGTATITFMPALLFNHWGSNWISGKDTVAMKGEVGLLTRNVKIHGDLSGTSDAVGWGYHLISYLGANMQIEYAEFFAGGQAGESGRYPIHWHRADNVTNSFARGNAIHDTFQRSLTIHQTNLVVVENNVAYNGTGHMYFFEDGYEYNNKFYRNLGIAPKIGSLIPSDSTPAVFWITNPSNIFYKCVAVGGTFGFWFALPELPRIADGVSYFVPDDPNNHIRNLPLADFFYNTAHSNSQKGLFIDDGVDDNGASEGPTPYLPRNFTNFLSLPGQSDLTLAALSPRSQFGNPDYSQFGEPVTANIVGLTVYKVSGIGVWIRGKSIAVYNSAISDCLTAIQTPSSYQLFSNSVVVGESNNTGTLKKSVTDTRTRPTNNPSDTILGYRDYDSGGGNIVNNVRFYNFKDTMVPGPLLRPSGAFGAQNGSNTIKPVDEHFGISFTAVDNKVYLQGPFIYPNIDSGENNPSQWGTTDVDGSLTGVCGSTFVSGAGYQLLSGCNQATSLSHGGEAEECLLSSTNPQGNLVSFTIAADPPLLLPFKNGINDDVTTLTHNSIQITRLDDLSKKDYLVPNVDPNTHNASFKYVTNLWTNRGYYITPGNSSSAWLSSIQIGFGGRRGEFIVVVLPYLPSVTSFSVKTSAYTFSSVSSLSLLTTMTYYWDNTKGLLYVYISKLVDNWDYFFKVPIPDDVETTTITTSCKLTCTPVPPYHFTSTPTLPSPSIIYTWCNTLNSLNTGLLNFGTPTTTTSLFNGTSGLFTGWNIINTNCTLETGPPKFLACLLSQTSTTMSGVKGTEVSLSRFTHMKVVVQTAVGYNLDLFITVPSGSNLNVGNPFYTNRMPLQSNTTVTSFIPISNFNLPTSITSINSVKFLIPNGKPAKFNILELSLVSLHSPTLSSYTWSPSVIPLAPPPSSPYVLNLMSMGL